MKSKLSIFFIILITLVSIMNISFAETGRLVDIPVPPNSSGYADFTEKEAADRAREYEESKNNAVTADYFVGKSSDNYLKSLNVEGYELSPEFNRQMDTYTIYVKDDSINTFNVTAENGDLKVYTINIENESNKPKAVAGNINMNYIIIIAIIILLVAVIAIIIKKKNK